MEQVALQEPRMRRWFDLGFAAESPEPGPIRAELMSVERLEQFAETLARSHGVATTSRHGASMLARTRQNARVLRAHFETVARTTVQPAQRDAGSRMVCR